MRHPFHPTTTTISEMKKPARILSLSIALLAASSTQSATLTWDAGDTGNGATIDPADGSAALLLGGLAVRGFRRRRA